MIEFDLQYIIENKYENPVRKANFQLLVIPDSNKEQKVRDLKFSCSGSQEMHISKNIFGFKTIQYYIDKPFSEFRFKLSAKIDRNELNPFILSPLTPFEEFQQIQLSDFYIDNYPSPVGEISEQITWPLDSPPRFACSVRIRSAT